MRSENWGGQGWRRLDRDTIVLGGGVQRRYDVTDDGLYTGLAVTLCEFGDVD